MKWFKGILLTAYGILSFLPSLSQGITKYSFGEGIRLIAADSSFSLKFSARIQSLYQGELNLADDQFEDGFQIRRSRLKFDGFVYSPKLVYKIELAIANSDIASGAIPQSGNTSSIVLDACVKWHFAGNWSLWFGQTKLPGNRERVISSQQLQFVDRSNVNAKFNLDRDAGIQVHYDGNKVNLAGAVSMGEGRNMIVENAGGYNYTLRAEYLPFGKFGDKGDYFGSDLSREPQPRLSIGITHDINNGATRERGQLGDFMPSQRDLATWFVDAHFKYRGMSSMLEYAHRKAPDGPVILDEEGNFLHAFYTGEGLSWQAGYLFKNNFEIAGRYTSVKPEVATLRNHNVQYTLGVSRYFVQHSLKIQSDISFIREDTKNDALVYRLQLELAF
jgi:hypothetical protein